MTPECITRYIDHNVLADRVVEDDARWPRRDRTRTRAALALATPARRGATGRDAHPATRCGRGDGGGRSHGTLPRMFGGHRTDRSADGVCPVRTRHSRQPERPRRHRLAGRSGRLREVPCGRRPGTGVLRRARFSRTYWSRCLSSVASVRIARPLSDSRLLVTRAVLTIRNSNAGGSPRVLGRPTERMVRWIDETEGLGPRVCLLRHPYLVCSTYGYLSCVPPMDRRPLVVGHVS